MNRKKEDIIKNNIKMKTIMNQDNHDVLVFVRDKVKYFQEITRNTILSIQQNKINTLFSNSDVNVSIHTLLEIYEKTVIITNTITNNYEMTAQKNEALIESLQEIVDKLSIIICGFGTRNFDDLLFICSGSQYLQQLPENEYLREKFELIRKYVHPIGYKNIAWKAGQTTDEITGSILCANKITDDVIHIEKSNHYECYDNDNSVNTRFFNKVYGIRVVLQNPKSSRTLIVTGVIDDIAVECISNKYIERRKSSILERSDIDVELYERLLKSFTLKDYLIYGNEDVYKKYLMIYADAALIKNTNLENIIRKFTSMDTFAQRNMLINLLCVNNNDEVKYITYLLYDVITATNGNAGEVVDSREQSLIYDSFPWAVKIQFKDIMKFTIKYTQDMMQKYDINRVSLEQQIYVMKVPEYIKEKAMVKLKEIKGKGDESSTKAKQYLEGLLKIPFGIYKKEPLLCAIKTINEEFKIILNQCDEYCANLQIPKKAQYANIEIISYMDRINICVRDKLGNYIYNTLKIQKNKQLLSILKYLRDLFTRENIDYVFRYGKKPENIAQIADVLQKHPQYKYDIFDMIQGSTVGKIKTSMSSIHASIKNIDVDLKRVHDVLDASIHGHDYAKNQILKIIGQWMNGEQTGYCFGFEGSPGVGKTSVAKKGLANCLLDADGASRPFAFIALGGSCNGSTLEGHSYTYVNSMWGRIVDILMETKCMNPIIYVDELDKVSKTEHGKEIIGILTHLIDTTQNDCFQDKYYSGINIDLSKALFIFSYNDPENIDRILLDRIHRIRFDNLTLENKMVIVKDYLLPEINEKMGFCDVVVLEEGVIEYLIETFTMEPGVRKLKEVIFDLYGEINLELLRNCAADTIPIVIKIEDLETKYLKKYHKIQETKIPEKSGIGIINGLWANALGKGGIIPIETMLYPCSGFLELKLTGLQGDVMKESMNVAKSLAWGLTPLARKKELIAEFEETKCQGLHIHCPQGAVSKDGPSAGTAITVAIYSLFNKRNISNTVAITGEINLQGKVTAIGGLDSKILGGIRAGVKRFLYPKENHREYVEFMEKYGGKSCVDGIEFIEVSTIEDVFPHVYDTF